jgi:crotonobetainyl-CoA:carnitine CoA-transferase CaiB-like acyl-CoA transferase
LESAPDPAPPLADVRVVLLGSGSALDMFGAVLAEQGADVVRVEPPGGDPTRQRGPHVDGASLAWAVAARGTRSVTAALDDQRGVDLVRRLVARSDLVGESLGAGVLEGIGLGPHDAAGPAAIVRFSDEPELIALARGGMLSVTGTPDRAPTPLGVRFAEQLAGVFGAMAGAAALIPLPRRGQPEVIDASSHGAVMRIMEWGIARQALTGEERQREGNRPSSVAPLDVYTAADGEHVAIVGGSDANFSRLVKAMEREGLLQEARFRTSPDRVRGAHEINQIVSDWVASLPAAEVERRCLATGTPASQVRTTVEMFDDAHFAARGDFVVVDDPVIGPHRQQAPHPRFVGRAAPVIQPAPTVGQHTDAVLIDELGFDPAQVTTLRSEGAL